MKQQEYSITEIDNSLFTCSKSDFNDFESMERYLDSLDIGLEIKLTELEKKRQGMLNQYKTSAMAYQINSKRRKKEQADMKEEYDKLNAMLAEHQRNLRLQVHPMTPDLMLKADQLDKLQQTKEVLDDLSKLMAGSNYDTILLLDDANFDRSASKISVIKTVLEEVQGTDYAEAKQLIDKKYEDLREKILTKFQAGYWKKSAKQVKDILPLCYRFNMMSEVSEFFIGKVFRQVNTLSNINATNQGALQAEIKSLFFLLQRGFKQALQAEDTATNQVNQHQLFKLFGDFSDKILKALINYAFETSIKTSLDNVLKVCFNNEAYLNYLQMFYDQTVLLVKAVESLSNNDTVTHLVQSYLVTLYDNYLEQYTYKQLGFLEDKYQEYIRDIMKNICQKVDFGDKRKFDWKKLFQDYKIQQSEKLNAEDMDSRITSILSIFMDINLEQIFEITNKSLQRNSKISRYTDREKQQVKILDLFGREMGDLIINLIKYSGTVVPNFNRKTVLSEQFFELVPQLGTLVQRLELIFQTFAVSKSSLNEAIRMEQQKEDLINKCQKELQKLLALALASLLVTENSILKETTDYRSQMQGQSASPGCSKVIAFTIKYVKKIRKNYSQVAQKRILQKMGCQFCDLLIQHFSTISYNKQGLYQMFVDLGHIKKFIYEFGSPQVQIQYSGLKALVDIYLLKNDETTLQTHISEQKQRSLANVSDESINKYIENKKRTQG